MKPTRLSGIAMAAILGLGTPLSSGEEPTVVLEAEQAVEPAFRFQDSLAAGKACAAASLAQVSGTLLRFTQAEASRAGLYRLRFHLRLSSLSNAVNTGLWIRIGCGESLRTLWQGEFLPPDRYTAFDVWVDHAKAGPLALAVTWGQDSPKDFFEKAFDKEVARGVQVEESQDGLSTAPEPGKTDASLAVDEGDEAMIELRGGRTLQDLKPPFFAIDRVEILCLQDIAHVSRVWLNKIRYDPGESGEATVDIRNYSAKARSQTVRVHLVKELGEAVPVWDGVVDLPGSGVATTKVPFQVGPEHFGRGLAVELIEDGRVIDRFEEPFGVSPKSYEISIWGSGPGQDNWAMRDDELERIVLDNHRAYANIYEFFSWAPCDFWEQSPDEEEWYSGQTQYHCGKRSIQRFHELCRRHGIQTASYYQAAAKPPDGLEALRRFPDWFSAGAIGIALWHIDVDALERMVRKEYDGPRGRLRSYQPMGVNTNLEPVVRHGANELVRSARMFGWDAVRYDGHFIAWGEDSDALTAWNDQLVRSVVTPSLPKYQYGYNAGTVQVSTDPTYDRPDLLNFVQMCGDGGLIMNEAFRDHPNRNFSSARIDEYLRWVSVEARATRRAGGYHLGFFFDRASPSDHTYNVAIELASGSRPLGYGGLARSWPRFVTRYSAYYWDNELFEIQGARDRVSVRSPVPVWFEPFCYRRPRGPGRGQYVVHLIVPPGYGSWNDILQPPAPVLRDLKVSLRPDEGWSVASAWVLCPSDPDRTGPVPFATRGNEVEITVPGLTLFGSVVLNVTGPAGQEMPVDRLPGIRDAEPLKAAWLKVEALRKQGYVTPADEARRAKELQSIERVLAHKADQAKPPAPTSLDPLGFRKVDERDEVAPPKDYEPPKDPRLRRNGLLDVRVGRGVFGWLMRLDEAFGRAGGAVVQSSFLKVAAPWADAVGKLTDVPWDNEEVLGTDVVVLNNIGACHFDGPTLHRIRLFLSQGGGLLILGGHWTLGKGGFRDSVLEDVLPVRLFSGDLSQEIRGLSDPDRPEFGAVLSPTPAAPEGIRGLPWRARPVVRSAHHIEPKPSAQVWLRAGDWPILVTGEFGRGRLAVWAGTVHGGFSEDEMPYWDWHGWPGVLAETLIWLGRGWDERYEPQMDLLSEDDAVAVVAGLAQAEKEERDRRLAAACSRPSPKAAAFLLTAHGDEIELTEDQILRLVERIRPGTGGLLTAARRFLASQQPPTLSAGVRLLGLSGDKSLEEEVLAYLNSAFTEVQTGAALALADIGSSRSLPALRRKTDDLERMKLEEELQRRLYHRVLLARHRLGDATAAGKLAAASLYSYFASEKAWRDWALLMEEAGTAFKKTAREHTQWRMKMRRALEERDRWRQEHEYLADALTRLPDGAVRELVPVLARTDELPAVGLVHRVLASADLDTVRGLMPLLEARMAAVAGAVASRARSFPELRGLLGAEILRLSQSTTVSSRLLAALHVDLVSPDVRKEILSRLVQDSEKAVRLAALRAGKALE